MNLSETDEGKMFLPLSEGFCLCANCGGLFERKGMSKDGVLCGSCKQLEEAKKPNDNSSRLSEKATAICGCVIMTCISVLAIAGTYKLLLMMFQ